MEGCRSTQWSRRTFLGGLALAGGAAWMSLKPSPASAEPPPETSTFRIDGSSDDPTLCVAPQYFAEGLLRAEGFTKVQFVPNIAPPEAPKALTRGIIDMTLFTPPPLIMAVDQGEPIVMLGGVHGGCYELFATDRIRHIHDLKGKSVAAGPTGSAKHLP